MAVHSKEFYKRYTVLLIALVCSLFIPFLLYSFQDTYQPVNSSYEYPSLVKYSYKWPKQNHFRHGIHPMTAKNTDTIKNHHYKAIDQKYCGKDRCKFILPVLITEQGRTLISFYIMTVIFIFPSPFFFFIKNQKLKCTLDSWPSWLAKWTAP
jgi:hypothetical protein